MEFDPSRAEEPDLLAVVRAALPFGAQVAALDAIPLSPRAHRLDCRLQDGTIRTLVAKRAPAREWAHYRDLLSPETTGAPALLGALPGGGSFCWLLLEWIHPRFWDPGEPAQIEVAFRHLGALHKRFARSAGPAGRQGPATELHAAGPRTLIHGDYHRWNVLLSGDRVRVLDWEHSRFGHPVRDLLMLEPEGPGFECLPGGAPAALALQVYHEHGPLAALPWTDFLCLQRTARLKDARAHARSFQERAAQAAPGAAEVLAVHARQWEERADRLAALL